MSARYLVSSLPDSMHPMQPGYSTQAMQPGCSNNMQVSYHTQPVYPAPQEPEVDGGVWLVVGGKMYFGDFTDGEAGKGISSHMQLWDAIVGRYKLYGVLQDLEPAESGGSWSDKRYRGDIDDNWGWGSMFNNQDFSERMCNHYKKPGPCTGAADPGYLRTQYQKYKLAGRNIFGNDDLMGRAKFFWKYGDPVYVDSSNASAPEAHGSYPGEDCWAGFQGEEVLTSNDFHRHMQQACCGSAYCQGTNCNQCQLVVVNFSASWCGVSLGFSRRAFSPASSDPAFRHVKFLRVDVDANPDLAHEYEISAIPTTIAFKGCRQGPQTLSRYLPKSVNGLLVLAESGYGQWFVDRPHSHPTSKTNGLGYRVSKSLSDKDNLVAAWGSTVQGFDEGDWVRVELPASWPKDAYRFCGGSYECLTNMINRHS